MSLRKFLFVNSKKVITLNRGFTLVELMVGLSIMAIILGITLSGGPRAITRLTLSDNTYQVELMIREAQLQGSAINSVDGLFGGVGVFFDRATSSQVLKFRDLVDLSIVRAIGVGNGLYDQSSSTGAPPVFEKETTFTLTKNNRIGRLCVATSTSPIMCNDVYIPHVNTLTVSFTRPRQTAHIYINGATSTENYTFACVEVFPLGASTTEFIKSILVYGSGMINKSSSPCIPY